MAELRTLEAMLAAGMDDCGKPLAECPGPPRPRPWAYGRPCGKAATLGWSVAARSEPLPTGGRRPGRHLTQKPSAAAAAFTLQRTAGPDLRYGRDRLDR